MKKITLLCLLPVLLLGCSNKQIYNAVQDNQRMECGKLPQSQYEDCLREYEMTYEEYERERQAAAESPD